MIKNRQNWLNMNNNLSFYTDRSETQKTAFELIAFGITNIKRAKVIRYINQIEKYILEGSYLDHEILSDLIFEHLVDNIRIILFFENYMKAVLIKKGFCVHNLKKEKDEYRILAESQYNKPISIHEIRAATDLKNISDLNGHFLKGLKSTTVNFSTLLSKNYCSFNNLDEDLILSLKNISKDRNKLHFNNHTEFYFSPKKIALIKKIASFVDQQNEVLIRIQNSSI